MALTPGTRIGSYEITAQIGVGGMGEVYRATDTNLGRAVAVKVLPESVAQDQDRLARFDREARTLAALNHPHIAAVYGLEKSAGVTALVMELVEGPTLADRIGQGPIPIEEALPIAWQMAEALEAAHEQGIVHRDLKPANVKVREDGTVKVLDFGLAKSIGRLGSGKSEPISQSPTVTAPAMTRAGIVLGTAAYMSPEQARGQAVDSRADIWAFGCVLYEMLTGHAAFGRATVTDTLAAVVSQAPSWDQLPPSTPGTVRHLLEWCLEKDARRRLRDIGDARAGLDGRPADEPEGLPRGGQSPARGRVWTAAAVLAALVAGALGAIWFRGESPGPEVRLDVTALPARNPTSMALSPDGSSLVYEGVANGQSQLWVRQLDADVSEPLEGTQGASHPFFAPDGGSLGYFAGGRLWLMEFQTGAARDLAGASFPTGGSWSRDGVILFVPGAGRPVMRVPAAGGEPTPVTDLRADEEFNHRSPSFLPDGRHFLYYVNGVPEARGVHVGNIDTRESRRLFDADAVARYMEPDVLLVIRQRTLFAQAFDPAALVFRGDPSPVATDITIDDQNVAAVSVASRGAVAYRRGAARVQRHLIWFDREGIPVERVGDSDGASALSPSLSPDGRRLVLYRTVNGNMDLWMLEMSSGVLSPLTRDATSELNPIWSPDGQRIVFSKAVGGNLDLYERSTSTGEESLFLSTPQSKAANDWASDGRFVLYRSNEERTGYDLWAVPVGGEREPFPVATADQDQREGQFSPDGRLVAYQSNESGMFQIWVQRFPGGEDKKQVSSFGGAQVRWHPDGNELFYVALDGMLMSVSIRADESGIENGVAVPLFPTQIGGAVRGPAMQQYLVSLESELRFLMNTVTEEASIPITIRLAGRPVP